MKFKLKENIYAGETNNKINKKKYKKHSMSPFVSLDAGNVPYNIMMFNKGNGVTNTEVSTSESGGEALGEGVTPTYTYSYKGPVYRFEKVYTVLDEPVYTTAQSKEHAANMIRGKLKKQFGFDYKAKLDIDDDAVELQYSADDEYEIPQDDIKKEKDLSDATYVGSIDNKDVYYLDGYYIVDDIAFVSYEDAKDYLEA